MKSSWLTDRNKIWMKYYAMKAMNAYRPQVTDSVTFNLINLIRMSTENEIEKKLLMLKIGYVIYSIKELAEIISVYERFL